MICDKLEGVEAQKFIRFSKDEKLTLSDCSHGNKYYGLKQRMEELTEAQKADIIEVEIMLDKLVAGLSSFCNFTGGEVNRVRFLYNYNWGTNNPQFIGVGYLNVDDLVEV